MKSFGQTLSRNVTLPIVALGAASVAAFDQQAKALAQVEAGLISTGNAAGFTSQELQKMAADLQAKTIFGDEVILKDATAQLLTFTNIAGEQFARTQQAALNLATRLDGDLKSASIQLGKALNDPVANLSALSRSGIQFSTEQKAVIKSLVETNKLAEAQTIILDELEKQYGGAAEAAAKAGLGPFQQLQNALSDVSEEFGKLIVENLEPFKKSLLSVIKVLRSLTDEQKKAIVKFGAIAAVIGPIILVIGSLVTTLSTVIPLVISFVAAFNPITAAIGAAVLAVGYFTKRMVGLNDEWKEYQETTDELDLGPVVGDFEKIAKFSNQIKTPTFERSAIPTQVTPLSATSVDTTINFSTAPEKITQTATAIENLSSGLTKMEIIGQELAATFSSAFESMANGAELSFKAIANASLNAAREVIKGELSKAIATQIGNILATVPFPLNIGIAAGAGAAVGGLFNKLVPKFADGGIVSGPTLGLMGEYAGANTNPEVIAPLNKLKDMMAANTVQVQGMISGEDIYLSNDRYSRRVNSY